MEEPMNSYIFPLIITPMIFAPLYLISHNRSFNKIVSGAFCTLGAIFSILLSIQGPQRIILSGGAYSITEGIITMLEVLITLYLFLISIKHKRWEVFTLSVISAALSVYSIVFVKEGAEAFLNADKLSIVLALIINIIGTLIVLFANEYMEHYEKHRNMKSRQKMFYFVICIFLSAMNGLIFSDSLSWIYFFWEVTTLISFILISYNNDNEAINSGFRALFLNLIGGICLISGVIILGKTAGINSLTQITQASPNAALFIAVALLCVAGFAKSAQFPFQSWLLGAMVAPTPVSALLHSSTMVNAGVYLIVKLSPAYRNTPIGTAIAFYGAFTFLICSAIAVTQKNAKKVLAYSTIANLGLVISSAGMGSSTAISAAIMLIIFHAISKALLFLCTGQIEHIIGSRDIEDMSGLISKAPIITIILAFGIISMILPPFGVLITKWVTIEASANNPFVTIFLILGSACTSVYYIKWLGTVLSYPVNNLKPKFKLDFTTYFPLWVLSGAILLTSIFMSKLFNMFVSPEVSTLLKSNNQLTAKSGSIYSQVGSFNDLAVFLILLGIVVVFLMVRKFILSPNLKKVYLCGENDESSGGKFKFRSGDGAVEKAVVANLYMYNMIDEKRLTAFGYIVSAAMIIIIFMGGLL
jgi:NADH:ubiquinone oxidoreductase subunit 5 (chain L)/Multisubunit Na+/H+ antiporter, MnhA subunit